ncbi:MAG TPA: ATP-grasp domain-containing protein [Candidatus Dormibacteraeota bacterium]|nr:ATP-grasp domain-containing protein [Candidatus Dormibacteraeota bacterium]
MSRILVLDGHSAAALAVTRSAGRAGHWVAVGANRGAFAAAKLSRYCRTAFDHPASTSEPQAFVDSVLDFVRLQAIDLVIPDTDWTLGPLSAQRERFAGLCRIAMPSQAALEFASDKHRTIQLAESLAIGIPKTQLLKSADDLSSLQSGPFPVVVKDRFSVRWTAAGAVFGSVSYAYSAPDLQSKVADRVGAAGDVLVQEFVSGVGIGFSCFVIGGECFLPFQWQRVREVDPRGSASSARRSMPLDSDLASVSEQLITTMGFEGIAMVEYKRARDGRLVLMEINGRPWGSIGLPIACGIDYPRQLIGWCLEGTLPPRNVSYRENVLCRRAVGELTHLSNIRGGRPANWPGRYPKFWPSLFAMAVPWRPRMCYDDLWLSDLRPGVAGIRNWFQIRLRGKAMGN